MGWWSYAACPPRRRGWCGSAPTADADLVVRLASQALGWHGFVVTTLEESSVAELKQRYPQLKVGLSLGRDVAGLPALRKVAVRLSELLPGRRIRRCRRDFLAV